MHHNANTPLKNLLQYKVYTYYIIDFENFNKKEFNTIPRRQLGIIHLVRTQNFLKNLHFLPPDTHTYVRVRIRG